eukprot:1317921-Amorphochlora_amoeboformis.AAC.1
MSRCVTVSRYGRSVLPGTTGDCPTGYYLPLQGTTGKVISEQPQRSLAIWAYLLQIPTCHAKSYYANYNNVSTLSLIHISEPTRPISI